MMMNGTGKVVIGRYDNHERLLEDLNKYDGKVNIYLTLNPI